MLPASRAALFLLLLGAIAACPDKKAFRLVPPDPPDADVDGGEDAGIEEDGGEDAGPDAGLDAGPDAGRPGCMPGQQYIYTFSDDRTLRRFDPPNLRFEIVGTLACQSASPFSMAVDRSGQAWVEYGDGNIYHVNTTNAACERTAFVPRPQGNFFSNFGMGFAAVDPSSPEDALFVSDVFGAGLAVIDTHTYELTQIGPFDGLTGDGLTNRAELTGTGDGRLYGGFEGSPFQLAQVEQTSGKILTQSALGPLDISTTQGSNFALAAFGSDFWLFFGPGSGSTNVYRFSPSTGETRFMLRVNFAIVGAGVSTCASQ